MFPLPTALAVGHILSALTGPKSFAPVAAPQATRTVPLSESAFGGAGGDDIGLHVGVPDQSGPNPRGADIVL